jgi:hypothetical protein
MNPSLKEPRSEDEQSIDNYALFWLKIAMDAWLAQEVRTHSYAVLNLKAPE